MAGAILVMSPLEARLMPISGDGMPKHFSTFCRVGLDMFSITAQACRSFTLAEVLIMAAMNVETIRSTSATRALAKAAAAQKG